MKPLSLAVAGAVIYLAVAVQPVHAQLLGWYTFNDPANLGLDSSGNGNNGANVSITQPVQYSPNGVFGDGAAEFDGEGSGYLTLPINASVTNLPDMTWGAWVNPTAVDGIRDILNIDLGGFGRNLNIDYRSGGDYNAFSGYGVVDSGVYPTVGVWTLIAAVYQDNYYGPGEGRMQFYIGDTVVADVQTDFSSPSASYIALGTSAAFDEYWSGGISDAFVDGSALTPSQISQVASEGPSVLATPEPSTVALAGVGAAAMLAATRRKR